MHLSVASNAEQMRCAVLLPQGATAQSVSVNGQEQPLEIEHVESSAYVVVELSDPGVQQIVVALTEL